MARMNKTRYAILGMLAQNPKSGYDIKKHMQRSVKYFWQESDGQIYPILKKLADEKLVVFKEVQNGKRSKKIYNITAAGKKELKEWLEKIPEAETPRNELMLKLFFGRNTEPEILLKHILWRKQELLLEKKIAEDALKHITFEHAQDSAMPYWQMTIICGINYLNASIKSADEILAILKKLEKQNAN